VRVLHVINSLDPGGAENLILGIAPLLEKRGIRVSVLALALRSQVLYKCLKGLSIDVTVSRQGSLYSPLQIGNIRNLVKERSVDVVHSHLFPAMWWVTLAQIGLPRVPIVVTEHNTWNRRRRTLWKPVDRFMYARCAKVACVSSQTETALREWVPETEGRTCVIENGIDSAAFNEQQVVAEAAPQSTLVTIARLTKQKAIDVLIRAVAELPGVTALVVGDGPMRRDLERLAVSLKVAERVRFLGARADVASILQLAPIYVQPSAWEGFGIAAVEAMAAGLAVVVSDVPGLREVVGDAGLRFTPGSHLDLAEVLSGLVHNRKRIAVLSERARSRAALFSISRTADEYAALYRQVLTSRQQSEGAWTS
jgi:glycosyltransferase involved in cell wall biosynthesis